MVTSVEPSENENPQASDTETENDGRAGQLIVAVGVPVIVGGVTSCTCINWEAVEELPHPSVAVHVLVVVYVPGHDPGMVVSLNNNVNALPQLSVAVATANTGVAGQLIVVGAGKAAMTGAVISWTLIV